MNFRKIKAKYLRRKSRGKEADLVNEVEDPEVDQKKGKEENIQEADPQIVEADLLIVDEAGETVIMIEGIKNEIEEADLRKGSINGTEDLDLDPDRQEKAFRNILN